MEVAVFFSSRARGGELRVWFRGLEGTHGGARGRAELAVQFFCCARVCIQLTLTFKA